MMRSRTNTLLAAAFGTLLASGCAVLERGADDTAASGGMTRVGTSAADGSAGDVVARDLLSAFVQLDGYSPDRTTVRFSRTSLASDPVVSALESRMRAAGYAVGIVDEGRSADAVGHDVEVTPGDTRAAVHTLSIGTVQMRRRYAKNATGRWAPDGSLFVRGADASGIRMDASAPETATTRRSAPTRVAPSAPPAPPVATPPRPARTIAANHASSRMRNARAVVSPAPVRSHAPARPLERPAPKVSTRRSPPLDIDERSGLPVYSGLVAPTLERSAPPRNVMGIGDSNFTSLFDEFQDVEELVLIFGNDSLVLGPRNKRLVRRAVESFDPRRDMFAIVGCSLGPTSIPNGNEALALGRANRVKEELLFAGVSQENIRDEGCWAGEASADFPARGVVLTHLRRAG